MVQLTHHLEALANVRKHALASVCVQMERCDGEYCIKQRTILRFDPRLPIERGRWHGAPIMRERPRARRYTEIDDR